MQLERKLKKEAEAIEEMNEKDPFTKTIEQESLATQQGKQIKLDIAIYQRGQMERKKKEEKQAFQVSF